MQWHQLDHMQTICTSLKTDNHTNTSSLKFYRLDALTNVQPTLSKHWRQRHCFTITIQCYWIQKSMASGCGMSYAHTQTDGQVKNIMSLWPQRTGGGCIITWYFKCLPLHMQSPPLQFICVWCHTHTHTFNGPFSGTTRVSRYQKGKNQCGFYWSKRQWVAVASAGTYASLHLAPDRWPHQHPTTQFLQAGCPSCRPTNSVKALKANVYDAS